MSDKSLTILVASGAAVLGACLGFMFFTERGRAFRRDLEPLLDEVAEELNNFRGTAQKAANVAHQGWRLVNETFGQSGAARLADPHQTAPF